MIELISKAKENYKKSKSILTIILTTKFRELYSSTSEEEQKLLINYISNGNKDAIIKWINLKTGEIPIMKLRRLAKQYGIKNYNRLTYKNLIIKLNFYLTQDEIITRSHL